MRAHQTRSDICDERDQGNATDSWVGLRHFNGKHLQGTLEIKALIVLILHRFIIQDPAHLEVWKEGELARGVDAARRHHKNG